MSWLGISRNSNRFLMGIERTLSQRGIIKAYENIPIQPLQVHRVLYNIHSERNQTDGNSRIDETKDSCSYSEDRFFLDFRGD